MTQKQKCYFMLCEFGLPWIAKAVAARISCYSPESGRAEAELLSDIHHRLLRPEFDLLDVHWLNGAVRIYLESQSTSASWKHVLAPIIRRVYDGLPLKLQQQVNCPLLMLIEPATWGPDDETLAVT